MGRVYLLKSKNPEKNFFPVEILNALWKSLLLAFSIGFSDIFLYPGVHQVWGKSNELFFLVSNIEAAHIGCL